MTLIDPIRLSNNLLLSCNEYVDGTHAVFVVCAAMDASERRHAVIDDDTDLRIVVAIAGEHYVKLNYKQP